MIGIDCGDKSPRGVLLIGNGHNSEYLHTVAALAMEQNLDILTVEDNIKELKAIQMKFEITPLPKIDVAFVNRYSIPKQRNCHRKRLQAGAKTGGNYD